MYTSLFLFNFKKSNSMFSITLLIRYTWFEMVIDRTNVWGKCRRTLKI